MKQQAFRNAECHTGAYVKLRQVKTYAYARIGEEGGRDKSFCAADARGGDERYLIGVGITAAQTTCVRRYAGSLYGSRGGGGGAGGG